MTETDWIYWFRLFDTVRAVDRGPRPDTIEISYRLSNQHDLIEAVFDLNNPDMLVTSGRTQYGKNDLKNAIENMKGLQQLYANFEEVWKEKRKAESV